MLTENQLAFSIEDTAAAIAVSRTQIYRLLASGELLALKCGGRTLIARSEIERYLSTLPAASIGNADLRRRDV